MNEYEREIQFHNLVYALNLGYITWFKFLEMWRDLE